MASIPINHVYREATKTVDIGHALLEVGRHEPVPAIAMEAIFLDLHTDNKFGSILK